MKKTFNVNICGSVFTIDEDAYNQLNSYLAQLGQAFPDEDGKEIVNDIEGRIAEHFAALSSNGSNVITINNVNSVIAEMGSPKDISDDDSEATPPPFPSAPQPPQPQQVGKKLYRSAQNKVFGGVFGGLAVYTGWNCNIMRLFYILLCLCTQGFSLGFVILYLIAWMVIPLATSARQILEMRGSPVTVGNVGNTILGTSDGESNSDFTISTFFSILGKVVIAFFGFIGLMVGIVALICLLMMIVGITINGFGGTDTILRMFDINMSPALYGLSIASQICVAIAVLIPCVGFFWGACSMIFKVKGASKTLITVAIILEIILIVASIVLLNIVGEYPYPVVPELATISSAGVGSTLTSYINC